MIIRNLKIAVRNLTNQKYYSLINIFGLALAIASSVIIFLWVSHELSYDKFYNDHKNIYRIKSSASLGGQEFNICNTPSGCALKLVESCPEVKLATIITPYQDLVFECNDHYYEEKKVIAADSNFFHLFSFHFIEGSAANAFSGPNSVVLTRSIAKKYFGTGNAVGKVLMINGKYPATVSSVIEDIPSNSHMHFSMVLYMKNNNNWNNFNLLTYILVKNNFNKNNLNNALKELADQAAHSVAHAFGMSDQQFSKAGNYLHFGLQPLTSIHLNSHLYGELEANGSKTFVIFFSVIAILILVIASINYMNLSTAYYNTRTTEIGIRKANGARRSILIRQFLTETLLISFIAFIVGMILLRLSLPFFNRFITIDINTGILNSKYFTPIILAFVLLLGLISGLYPAASISRVKFISIRQNKSTSTEKRSFNTRSALVIFQFTITIVVIVATVLIKKQVNFFLNKDLGFNSQHLVVIEGANYLGKNEKVFKTELKRNPKITNLCFSDMVPGGNYQNVTGYNVEGYPPTQQFVLKTIFAGADYFDTYKMKILKGRKFRPNDNPSIILNEKAVALMHIDNPLNSSIIWNHRSFPVVGVVKNFNNDPLNVNLDPILIRFLPHRTYNYITIRLAKGDPKYALSFIKNKWNELSGNKPFEYYFLDSKLESEYKSVMKAGNILTIFSVISVIIACMGILGIASFTLQRRIKEIGIRKVNGARISEILALLNRDFIKWVAIAFILACPIAWYAMDRWLENFAYQTTLSWWIFVLAGGIALVVALLMVSYQAWKAATSNPVEALRYE